jgi:hypothetical protein
MEEREMDTPQGYRLMESRCIDRDSGNVRVQYVAIDATIAFQLRWEEYREKGLLLASYEAGSDPIIFSWTDDIRDPIKLPPNSKIRRYVDWIPCDAL